MTMMTDQLVELGSRFSSQRMLEQLPVSIAVARRFESVLGTRFPSARIGGLEALYAQIEALFGEQAGRKYGAATGNLGVDEAMVVVKEGIRDIVSAADNAFEEMPEIRDQFHRGGPAGRSIAKTIKKAETLLSLADANAAVLAEWGHTAEETAAARTALSRLVTANTTQEQSLKDLPPQDPRALRGQGERLPPAQEAQPRRTAPVRQGPGHGRHVQPRHPQAKRGQPRQGRRGREPGRFDPAGLRGLLTRRADLSARRADLSHPPCRPFRMACRPFSPAVPTFPHGVPTFLTCLTDLSAWRTDLSAWRTDLSAWRTDLSHLPYRPFRMACRPFEPPEPTFRAHRTLVSMNDVYPPSHVRLDGCYGG